MSNTFNQTAKLQEDILQLKISSLMSALSPEQKQQFLKSFDSGIQKMKNETLPEQMNTEGLRKMWCRKLDDILSDVTKML